MSEVKWVCRSCGHKHRNADWLATDPPRHCHACGAQAVLPDNDPRYDWQGKNESPDDTPAETPPDAAPEPSEESEDGEESEEEDEEDEPVEHRARPKPKAKAKPKKRAR